ncbi:DUF5710 domain-containing protein [Nocardia donostiensis]|uniref:DUF5710 domain-containing protein n=1 Tax=Nocardia donostiensis TaxID=1538463 RepID=UPI0011155677|nr:DUF5710 domain-containing protein [Nocardia donostiensis]
MERPARKPYARSFLANPRGEALVTDGKIKSGDVVNGRRYLDVPFADNTEVKNSVQAKFDWDLELWHVDADISIDRIARWLPPTA